MMLDDNSVMSFGTHRGKYMLNVPNEYLEWLYDNVEIYGELKPYIEERLGIPNDNSGEISIEVFTGKMPQRNYDHERKHLYNFENHPAKLLNYNSEGECELFHNPPNPYQYNILKPL